MLASSIGKIPGIGELTVYDTALRVGANLKLEPKMVFMHSGTRVGAKRLALDVSREYLTVEELPAAFRVLRPREIEDILCIYKDHFSRGKRKPSSGAPCYS